VSASCYHDRDLSSGRCIRCGAHALVRFGPLRPLLGTVSKVELADPLRQLDEELRRRAGSSGDGPGE
jgi:hypothetical protein